MSNFDKDVDFKVLIPNLREHWLTDDIDEWIHAEGDYAHLIAYARILWPEFLEHDGCIFRRDRFTEANYLGFMTQTNGDKTTVEVVMNHEHVLDIFARAGSRAFAGDGPLRWKNAEGLLADETES